MNRLGSIHTTVLCGLPTLDSCFNKITKMIKKIRLVKSLLTFAVTKHNGAQINFGPPVFSWKTNSSASASSGFTRSCTTCFPSPQLTSFNKITNFRSTEDIYKKMTVYLKHAHKMTSEDTSRPETFLRSSAYLPIKTTLKGITWRYINFTNKECFWN